MANGADGEESIPVPPKANPMDFILHEVEDRLLHLVERAEGGESVTVIRRGVPVARIVPMDSARGSEADFDRILAEVEAIRGSEPMDLRSILAMRDEGRA